MDLTNTPTREDCDPAFSPDGTKIAYEVDSGPETDVFVMNADGSGQSDITNDPTPGSREMDPSWQSIQSCGGRQVTQVGDDGPDKIFGTRGPDVIAGLGGRDVDPGTGRPGPALRRSRQGQAGRRQGEGPLRGRQRP